MHILREAVETDRPSAVRVWDESGITQPWNDPPHDFDLAMNSPASTMFVAEAENGDIDGIIMVGFDGHRGWIHMTGVRPRARGLGLGRKLSDAALDWLRAHDAPVAHLMIAPGNDAGQAFWEKLGFFKIDAPVWMVDLQQEHPTQ